MFKRILESLLWMLTQFIISIIISFLVFLIYFWFDKTDDNYLYNAFFLFLVTLFFEKISIVYENSKIHKFWHYLCLILLVTSSIFLWISIPDSLWLYRNWNEFNSSIYFYVSIFLLLLNFIILFIIKFYDTKVMNNYKKRLKTPKKTTEDKKNELKDITEDISSGI